MVSVYLICKTKEFLDICTLYQDLPSGEVDQHKTKIQNVTEVQYIQGHYIHVPVDLRNQLLMILSLYCKLLVYPTEVA